MSTELETLATRLGYPEAPRVDEHDNLYFSDVMLGGIYKRSPDGTISRFLPDRMRIGGMALNSDGAIIVSGAGGLIYFNEKTAEQRPLFTDFDGQPIDTVNDIQPDGKGGLFAGLFNATAMRDGRPAKGSPLVRLDRHGNATRLWDGIVIPNGMGLSPDGSRLYHCETGVGVWSYDIAADDTLATRRLLTHLPDCDGMAVDSEGSIWVARYASGEVVRLRPDGSVERRIPVPAKHVLSVTFGGKDLRDLYIVTASDFRDGSPRTGAIFRTRSDTPGLETPRTGF